MGKRTWLLALALAVCLSGCGKKVDPWQEQYDLALAYLEDLDYENAIDALEEALDLDAQQMGVYLSLAETYLALDDRDGAIAWLETGLDTLEQSWEEGSALLAQLLEAQAAELAELEEEEASGFGSLISGLLPTPTEEPEIEPVDVAVLDDLLGVWGTGDFVAMGVYPFVHIEKNETDTYTTTIGYFGSDDAQVWTLDTDSLQCISDGVYQITGYSDTQSQTLGYDCTQEGQLSVTISGIVSVWSYMGADLDTATQQAATLWPGEEVSLEEEAIPEEAPVETPEETPVETEPVETPEETETPETVTSAIPDLAGTTWKLNTSLCTMYNGTNPTAVLGDNLATYNQLTFDEHLAFTLWLSDATGADGATGTCTQAETLVDFTVNQLPTQTTPYSGQWLIVQELGITALCMYDGDVFPGTTDNATYALVWTQV